MAAFGSAIGGGSEIQAAMARRGMTGPTGTTQASPASPTFNPQAQPPPAPTSSAIPSGMTATSLPVTPQPMPVTGAPSAMGNVANPEAQLIVRALTARLAALTKQEVGTGGGATLG